MKLIELVSRKDAPENDLTLNSYEPQKPVSGIVPILLQTPGIFVVSPLLHFTYFDKLFLDPDLRWATGARDEMAVLGVEVIEQPGGALHSLAAIVGGNEG